MERFSYEVRVRYAETDQMGVSYYSNYLVWFEVARTEFFRSLGLEYSRLEKKGFILPVLEAHCFYLAPSAYDDVLVITTCVSKLKRTSLSFQYCVTKKSDGTSVARGETSHAFVDKNFKPIRIPDEVRKLVKVSKL